MKRITYLNKYLPELMKISRKSAHAFGRGKRLTMSTHTHTQTDTQTDRTLTPRACSDYRLPPLYENVFSMNYSMNDRLIINSSRKRKEHFLSFYYLQISLKGNH